MESDWELDLEPYLELDLTLIQLGFGKDSVEWDSDRQDLLGGIRLLYKYSETAVLKIEDLNNFTHITIAINYMHIQFVLLFILINHVTDRFYDGSRPL